MPTETHSQIASFIWSICNLLRGPYKRNEYRKVILPLTVLRRFDCILAPTKPQVLKEHAAIKAKGENIIRHRLSQITGVPFFNLSKFTMAKPGDGSGLNGLLDDPNHLAPNLNSYINGFSPNVRAIMERFGFDVQIAKMAEKDLLYLVIKQFAAIDLSPDRVDNMQMGYVFEELIRIGAEQSNEEAGEHFTPREVIKLMVNLLLSPEKDLARTGSHRDRHKAPRRRHRENAQGGHGVKLSAYPRTKPSGVEWLGDVPEHWSPIALRRTSTRYAGGTPDRSNDSYWDEGTIPWINSGAVNQGLITEPSAFITEEAYRNSSARWVAKGALVMALAGQGKTKGMVAQTGIATTCNQSMAAICPTPPMEARYLYWLLVAQYEQIRNMAGGEARDGLNLEILGSIPCLKVPPAEQLAIAAFLDRETGRVDRLVAKKRELIERLKEKRTALISRTVTRGLPPAAARAGGLPENPPLKPSNLDWLGDIPNHWEAVTVRRRARRIQTGGTPPTAEERYYEDGTVPWFGPGSFDEQIAVTQPIKLLNESAVKEGAARMFAAGATMVVTIGATLGKVSSLTEAGSCNQQITVIEFNHRRIHPRFATYQLKRLEPALRAIAPSATLPILDQGEIADIALAVPPLPEQAAIAAYLDEETAKLDALVGNLDIFWLKDEALEESANLPPPEIIAQEISDDLEAALEQFATIAEDLRK